MKAICPVCGKEFTQPERPYGGRPKHYCSNRCRKVFNCQQYKRKQHEAKVAAIKARPCAFCGKDFKPSLYRPAQKFCSHRCWLAARLAERAQRAEKRKAERLAKRQRVCPVCGKAFVAPPTNPGAKYCSIACSNRARATSMAVGRNVSASKARNAAPNITFVQKSEPQERSSIARVEAYLSLPAAERWARRDTLTKKEQAMARDLWLKIKCQRPVYHSAMAY